MRKKSLGVALLGTLLCVVFLEFKELLPEQEKEVRPRDLPLTSDYSSPTPSAVTSSTSTVKVSVAATKSKNTAMPTPAAKKSINPKSFDTPTEKESENLGKYVPSIDPRPIGIDYVAPTHIIETLGCSEDSNYFTIKSLVHLKGGVYVYKVGWEPAVAIYNGEELTVKINLTIPKDNIVPDFAYNNGFLYLTGIQSGKTFSIDTGKIKPSEFCNTK